MNKIAWLSVLFTLAMICGGCTGAVAFDWGPEGTQYERTVQPHD